MYTLIDALPRFLRHWRWWHAISGLAFSQKKVSVRESARLFCTTSVRKASQLCSFFPILIPKGKCTCLASRLSRRRCPRKATRYPLRLDFHRGVNSCLGAQRKGGRSRKKAAISIFSSFFLALPDSRPICHIHSLFLGCEGDNFPPLLFLHRALIARFGVPTS